MKRPIKKVQNLGGEWLIVTNRERDESNFFRNELEKASKTFQIPLCNCRIEKYSLGNNRNKDFIMDFIKHIPNIKDYRLVIVILCNRTHDQYKYIKKFLNSELGLPSQVVRSDRFNKGLSYFSKVILQINAKLGGESYNIYFNNEDLKEIVIYF
jgi:hypothetical protein